MFENQFKISDEGVPFILDSLIDTLSCLFEEIDFFVTNAADKFESSGVIGDKEG